MAKQNISKKKKEKKNIKKKKTRPRKKKGGSKMSHIKNKTKTQELTKNNEFGVSKCVFSK